MRAARVEASIARGLWDMKIDISPIDKKGRSLFDARRGRVRACRRDRARAPVAQGHSVA